MSKRLTAKEITELCGPGIPAAQVRALRRMGIRAERDRLGHVVVLRAWLTQDCRQAQHVQPEEPALNL